MSKEKAAENRREDKKSVWKFIGIMVLCGALGFFVGLLGIGRHGLLQELGGALLRLLSHIAPFGVFVCTTITLAVSLVLEKKSRRLYAGWDGEDEKIWEKIEEKPSIGLILCSMNIILAYFFFGASVYFIGKQEARSMTALIQVAVQLAGIVYMLVAMVSCQKRLINLEKEINPEKHGSVYDYSFTKKWMASCDEAEKFQIYKCAYAAFQTMNTVFVFGSVVSLLGLILFDFGLGPLGIVTALWAVMQISYFKEAMRISKHPGELMK